MGRRSYRSRDFARRCLNRERFATEEIGRASVMEMEFNVECSVESMDSREIIDTEYRRGFSEVYKIIQGGYSSDLFETHRIEN